ncbi:MAG: alpha/beta hydrolase [Rhodospirillaceae bacterium]|nr:alpha/beta hydrolase [Rhodospirillaceae bacterium]
MPSPEGPSPETVWRGYDQAGLDRQYNLRARHPEHPEFFAAYAGDSADVRARLARVEGSYGAHPRQRVIFYPAEPAGAPMLAFIHGGYWQALSPEDFEFLAPAFVARGITFAAIGYELCPTVSFATLVEQVRSAVLWLYDHAGEYGADPERLFLSGHSAGAHLTALMASTDWPALGHPAGVIKGAAAISGLYDLEPVRLSFLNGLLGLDAATAGRLSPLSVIPPTPAPPLVLSVGGDEPEEFHRQQHAFAEAWQAAGHALRVVEMPGYHHFDVVQAFGRGESPLCAAVCDLILAYGR